MIADSKNRMLISPSVSLHRSVGWLLPYLNLHESPQALHPYLYGKNNPVNSTDPLGLLDPIFLPGIYPTPAVPPTVPSVCKKECKKWGPSIAETLGLSVWNCANFVMQQINGLIPGGDGTVIIGGLIGLKYPPIAAGIGIGLGIDFGAALAFCSNRECIEW
ncbi:MAG: hypothetical protein WHS88_12580 [Anaerohalosphaeraceae bacterium]